MFVVESTASSFPQITGRVFGFPNVDGLNGVPVFFFFLRD